MFRFGGRFAVSFCVVCSTVLSC